MEGCTVDNAVRESLDDNDGQIDKKGPYTIYKCKAPSVHVVVVSVEFIYGFTVVRLHFADVRVTQCANSSEGMVKPDWRHPSASVIERDANPSLPQSLAVGGEEKGNIQRQRDETKWSWIKERGEHMWADGRTYWSGSEKQRAALTDQGRPKPHSQLNLLLSSGIYKDLEAQLLPGFALEATSSCGRTAEGECCGSCSPPHAPPLVSPLLTVEEPSFTTVELCQDGQDMHLTAKEG